MLGVHVTFQVREVGVLLITDLTDRDLLLADDALVTVVLLRPRETLVANLT